MQIWDAWLDTLAVTLQWLGSDVGLGTGAAVLVLTLALRLALLPISWSSAYRSSIHRKQLEQLGPELRRLKERYADQPRRLMEETAKLYRRRNVAMFEARPVFGAVAQMPVLLGMFQLLRDGVAQARFLWVASLSRPDFWIAVLAAATTALMMLANPDLPEQTRLLLIVIPSVIAFVFALKFASALGLYWVASNMFTAAQTYAVHRVVGRRIRAGTLRI